MAARAIALPLLPIRSKACRPASTTSSTFGSALLCVVALCSIPYDEVARCISLAPESFRQATWVPDTMWEEGLHRMELLAALTRAATITSIARMDSSLSPDHPVPMTGTTYTVGQLDLVSGASSAATSSQNVDTSAGSSSNDAQSNPSNQADPASRFFYCRSCGKQCGSFFVHSTHARRCTGPPEPMDLGQCGDVEDEQAARAEVNADMTDDAVAQIRDLYLDVYGRMHYEHYATPADVQRAKLAAQRVSAKQTDAIKRALKASCLPGTDLDSLINPIMQANEAYINHDAEVNARNARYEYSVTPRRRSLGTIDEVVNTGGGHSMTRTSELYMYDIPLEETLQRQLYYDRDFGQHFVDWGGAFHCHMPTLLSPPPQY